MSTINKSVGFIFINETATIDEERREKLSSLKPKIITMEEAQTQRGMLSKATSKKIIAEVILQDMNVLNRNRRFYADDQMLPALRAERLTELVNHGRLYGEEGHPLDKSIQRQQIIEPSRRCFRIIKYWTEGNDIKAHVTGSNLEFGKAFNQDLLDGEYPSFSLRALGTINNTKRGAEVQNITIITWDNVIYPSHKRAYTSGLITEGASLLDEGNSKVYIQENDKGLIIPVLNKANAIEYVKEESANLKLINNQFDTITESSEIINNGRQVRTIATNGDVIVTNIEEATQNILMDYYTHHR